MSHPLRKPDPRDCDEEGFLKFLVSLNRLSPGQATHYQKLARRWGSTLFDVLFGANAFEENWLSKLISVYCDLPYVELSETTANFALFSVAEQETYLNFKVIPYRKVGDHVELLCAIPSAALHAWARKTYAKGYTLSVATPTEIVAQIKKRFRPHLDINAREKLYKLNPDDSAKNTLTRNQKIFLGSMPVVLGTGLYLDYSVALFMTSLLVNCYYAFTLIFRTVLTALGSRPIAETEVSDEEVAEIDERELPMYTVMVAMYKEGSVLPGLTQHLRELDYPRSKLEIKIVLEEDDHETLEVAKTLHLENFFEFVIVPASLPKTKPKALNYALPFAKGEFLTIYDAEDRPDPYQLKKSFLIFKRLKDISCVQARLNYFNSNENFLTRMFTIEYSQWFDFFLLGLYRMHIPIPLGGTSNHFRTQVLRDLGGWDPYNVTEDADLGLRMEKYGHRVAIVNSTTFEEANTHLGNWIRQRSRWLKGHMQTFLIHMRNPWRLFKEIGPVGFFGFMFFIGGPCFIALLNPLLWALVLTTSFIDPGYFAKYFPPYLLKIAYVNLIFGNSIFILLGAWAVVKRRNWPLLPWAICLPIYWLLQSVAAYKALWQLIFKPHFWEKTTHGLSTQLQPGGVQPNAAPTPAKKEAA